MKRVLARSMSALLTRSRLSRRDFLGFFGPSPGWGWEDATIGAGSPRCLRTRGLLRHLKPRKMPGLAERLGRILLPASSLLPRPSGPARPRLVFELARAGDVGGRGGGEGEGRASERQNSRLHNCSFKCLAPRSRP